METIQGHVCRSCRHQLAIRIRPRPFSTTSKRSIIPPEAPNYIDVPQSHQPHLPWSKPEKGMLPKPRELFPEWRPERGTPQYLDSVAPFPSKQPKATSPAAEYKVRMAEARRNQFRTGLSSLKTRRASEIRKVAGISAQRQQQRADLLAQAEREDARLTNVSIVKEMQPGYQNSLAALEAEVETAQRIHARKVENVARVASEKHAEKMDALHTLYMNARNFVTTEDQLKKLIDDQFDASPPVDADFRQSAPTRHADFRSDMGNGTSMWNFRPPQNMRTMINQEYNLTTKNTAGVLSRMMEDSVGKDRTALNREQERFKRIAEKLSGGKI